MRDHFLDTDPGSNTTRPIAGDPPIGRDPERTLSILKDMLDPIVHQAILPRQTLEYLPIIPTHAPSIGPKPQNPLPILQHTRHRIVHQTLFPGQA